MRSIKLARFVAASVLLFVIGNAVSAQDTAPASRPKHRRYKFILRFPILFFVALSRKSSHVLVVTQTQCQRGEYAEKGIRASYFTESEGQRLSELGKRALN